MSDLVKRLRQLSGSSDITVILDRVELAADRIAELEAEVARLQAGGCARDKRTTQYCAEAMIASQRAEAAERRAERLAGALREARETIAHWGSYAGEYFQQKHNLAGDLAEIDAALADETGSECLCFGNSGVHASTHNPFGDGRRHCDLCGRPVQRGSTDVLTAINSTDEPGEKEGDNV